MSQKKSDHSIVLMATSFIGGLAAGFLLAPKNGARNRAWLASRAGSLAEWVDTQRQTAHRKGKKEIHKFQRSVQHGIRQHVPDLYQATEDIDLSGFDLDHE